MIAAVRFQRLASQAVFAFALATSTVSAQEPHQSIRDSLVHIRATALSNAVGSSGHEVEAQASGFLVSSDGLILTNYHVLDQLGEVFPKSVRFEVAIGEKTADRRPAATINGNEMLDLLLLKIPPAPTAYVPVPLGSAYEHPEGGEIHTSGFPDNLSYRKQTGAVEAREGPGGYLWATDFDLRSGQSGSPVYNGDGVIIGVIKGDDESGSFIIPIDFADGLIAQVRIKELRDRLSDLEKRIEAADGE